MAPTAIFYPPANSVCEPSPSSAVKGPALVIGSLSTAQDGRYQSVLESLEHRDVERHLVDRIIDGATSLPSSRFSSVYVVLAPADYDTLSSRLSSFFTMILLSLSPLGLLHISNLASSLSNISSELTLAGFIIMSHRDEAGNLIAQKPTFSPGVSVSLKKPSAPASFSLPRRNLDPSSKSSKQALWAINSPAIPPIDPESLLTTEDRTRPAACEPMVKGGPRRKKACKGCTCGLAELEAEEQLTKKIVMLDGAEGGEAKEVVASEKNRLATAAKASNKATSSCGSCFLGDAFRCASCPYLGLPAFKPGEKVEIDLDSDDL